MNYYTMTANDRLNHEIIELAAHLEHATNRTDIEPIMHAALISVITADRNHAIESLAWLTFRTTAI